jgi:hypothetical protein
MFENRNRSRPRRYIGVYTQFRIVNQRGFNLYRLSSLRTPLIANLSTFSIQIQRQKQAVS